ncbi:DUF262 domain-containing protein [Flavobacterium sp. PLA-1-15]|uniref:DUF262 domain-containing protein n=1 Tax=Flavobacterium sp. PLA-1-15 TaxID=3380533 RepID=UPI003B82BC56
MLSASKEKLLSFLNGSSQYIIPFFQRSYVWKVDNWSELWENIIEEYEEMVVNNNLKSEHFIGTIIIKQMLSSQVGATEYELIDGQQRMTTISLLLKAFHDATPEDSAKTWINKFLTFEDSYGNEKIRIQHSKVDSEYFQSIIQDKNNNEELWNKFKGLKLEEVEKKLENENRIVGGYIYYRHKVETECNLDDLRKYINVVIEKLPVIHMALNADDDVQQIFDTINSLGVKLTTAELLKNYLFSEQELRAYYETYWQSVFETDEDAIDFWNQEKTSGRIRRTTVELFLYSYLVIKKEANVKLDTLFKEFKNYLKDKTAEQKIAFAKDINEYAKVYEEMPDGENLAEISFDQHEKRFFHVIREFDVNTIFPLVLMIYKEVTNLDERIKILKVLESYISRRTICKLTTKNYNNLFISILSEVKKMEIITAENLLAKLNNYSDVTNKFPSDKEFKDAFYSKYLINKYSREVLYCIALYELNHAYVDNRKLNFSGFSVEHMMPKNWVKNWKILPDGITKEVRSGKLLTLGNLTLIQGKLNSALRDSSWSKKRAKLKDYSTLKQTTDYLAIENWQESEIDKRAENLFKIAEQIWKK